MSIFWGRPIRYHPITFLAIYDIFVNRVVPNGTSPKD